MNHKDIKLQIKKQLQKQYPAWNRLSKKEKKQIVKDVLAEVVADYNFDESITASRAELLGIERQVLDDDIIPLPKMAELTEKTGKNRIFKLSDYKRSVTYIYDEKFRFVGQLIDNRIINGLLAYDGYTPAMRDTHLCNLFQAELLKAIKYPEISYRKFCTEKYFGLERKQNRVFMGLPLNTNGGWS